MKSYTHPDAEMAAAITRAASKQTDLTIRCLVDKNLVEAAYRAYGYFRWVDDWLDHETRPRQERLDFVARQRDLMDACYQGRSPGAAGPEETMLVTLVAQDPEPHSGLQVYLRNMMAVMAFDADRRGRLISEKELDEYIRWLATAVTEAMHYFIGHHRGAPKNDARIQAVRGAHITHMLRDAVEDADAGYFNIPREALAAGQITPLDVRSSAYRSWVKGRVQKARECFQTGREYLAQVESWRCRLAGYAYTRRFELVLDSIEREDYLLRRQYPERKEAGRAIEMIGLAFWMALKTSRPAFLSSNLSIR